MKQGNRSANVTLTLDLRWEKNGITHHEHFFIDKLNTWRDILCQSILGPVVSASPGESFNIHVPPGKLISRYQPQKKLKIKPGQITLPGHQLLPGRFYPQGLLSGIPGVFNGNKIPFRLLALSKETAWIDLNHPLADISMDVQIHVMDRTAKGQERGGTCVDWIETAVCGPGMQKRRSADHPTCFITGDALFRQNDSPDEIFYRTDRFVPHIDTVASRNLSGLYRKILSPSDSVLDLMSGWISHLPENFQSKTVYGLGMNKNEMRANPALSNFFIQDLNHNFQLPFPVTKFDAAICSLSVEYLTSPISVFKQVAKVLKPGGVFAVAFSNRWFPEKAVHIWTQLHDFERMGMVLEYFIGSGCFSSLKTFSIRGYPRPANDRYSDRLSISDPVYVVTGKTFK